MKITNLGVGVGFIRCNFFQSPSSYTFFLIFQLEIVFDTQKSNLKKIYRFSGFLWAISCEKWTFFTKIFDSIFMNERAYHRVVIIFFQKYQLVLFL